MVDDGGELVNDLARDGACGDGWACYVRHCPV